MGIFNANLPLHALNSRKKERAAAIARLRNGCAKFCVRFFKTTRHRLGDLFQKQNIPWDFKANLPLHATNPYLVNLHS